MIMINDIVVKVVEENGLIKVQVKFVVEVVFKVVIDVVIVGEEIFILGFGKFKVKEIVECEGCNLVIGVIVIIVVLKKLVFMFVKVVKDVLKV